MSNVSYFWYSIMKVRKYDVGMLFEIFLNKYIDLVCYFLFELVFKVE